MEASADTFFCPAISCAMLRPFCQRINRCRMSIVDKGNVAMEMMGKAPCSDPNAAAGEITKELIYISSDGMKIQVYQNSDGVHCFGGVPLSGVCKEYVYPNFPARLWKKYSHAYKFVEVVKSKTPRVILLTDKAKCKLMENLPVPDFETDFHDGVRIVLNKGKIHITEKKGGTMTLDAGCLKDRVTENTMEMIEYTIQCQRECHRIQDSIVPIQARDNLTNVFPVTVGSIHHPLCIFQPTSHTSDNFDQASSDVPSDVNYFYQELSYQRESIASVSTEEANHEIGFQQGFPKNNFLYNDAKVPISSSNECPHVSTNCTVNSLDDYPHISRTTQDPWITSHSCESYAVNFNSTEQSPQHFHASMSQEAGEAYSKLPLENVNCPYMPVRSPCNCDTPVNGNNEERRPCLNESSKKQEFSPVMTHQDLSNQSESLVPSSVACQSQKVNHFPPGLQGNCLRTPIKYQNKCNTAQDQPFSEGCPMKSPAKNAFHHHHFNNVLKNQDVKRNLFGDKVQDEPKKLLISSDSIKPSQKELQGAKCPDLLEVCYTGIDQRKMLNSFGNVDSHSNENVHQDYPSTLLQETFQNFNDFNAQKFNQQFSVDSGVNSETNEIREIIDKLENCHSTSENQEVPISIDQRENLDSSAQFNISTSNCCSAQGFQTEFDPQFALTSNVPLQPPQSFSPKKLSRKVATSLSSSINSKFDNIEVSEMDGSRQESMTTDRSYPDNNGTRESIYEQSSGSDFSSFDKHNTSFPTCISARRGMHLKLQDKFNTTLPHSPSPSHSRMMPNFPFSPQKEFLQGGTQGIDNTLPPQVRNSLDMSISSYYSDSPSSSPSSSCDPIYQVFVPYIGWASYYAGGAVWVLYNDGTQLGVKAMEAVMTFIDQDGSQKKYKNTDVVPEIVKMKLEKLPNILKTVMKNKNYGNVS